MCTSRKWLLEVTSTPGAFRAKQKAHPPSAHEPPGIGWYWEMFAAAKKEKMDLYWTDHGPVSFQEAKPSIYHTSAKPSLEGIYPLYTTVSIYPLCLYIQSKTHRCKSYFFPKNGLVWVTVNPKNRSGDCYTTIFFCLQAITGSMAIPGS